MILDDFGILSLTQDFEQIIVSDEVEAGELLSLLFKVVVKSFLAHLELSENGFKGVLETGDLYETHDLWICANTESD